MTEIDDSLNGPNPSNYCDFECLAGDADSCLHLRIQWCLFGQRFDFKSLVAAKPTTLVLFCVYS